MENNKKFFVLAYFLLPKNILWKGAEKLEEYHGRTPYRILFLKDSDGKQAVVADIYPENYYEDYFSGQKSLDEIGESILNFYDKATGEFCEEYETLADYSQIRNKLSFMFISRHRNRDMLKQLVYIDYGDIALIFQVVFINRKQCGVASSKINYQMLKHWGISKEQLYTDGVLLIHHKNGSRKFYDLADRYFSRDLLDAKNPCPDELSFLSWRIRRRIGAVGLLWNRRSDAFLGIDMNTEQRDAAFEKLEAEGSIQKAAVDGIRFPVYFLTEDLPLVDAVLSDDIDLTQRLEFLAPLDPMLWDRKLIEAIWDYQYSWEIYTPAEKRKYGYYVLPMLYGEKMAGRIEAAADRKAETLVVKNIWYESGIHQTKKLNAAVDAAIGRLAKLNNCSRIAK